MNRSLSRPTLSRLDEDAVEHCALCLRTITEVGRLYAGRHANVCLSCASDAVEALSYVLQLPDRSEPYA